MQRPTTPEWSKPPHLGEWPRKTSIDSASSFLSPPPFGDFPRKKSIDSATSFLSPPLWGEAITNNFHIHSNGKSFSASPFGSCDNMSEEDQLQQQQQEQRSQLRRDLLPTHNKARKVRSDEQVEPKDKYNRLKLKSGSAFAQSHALLNSASAIHLNCSTDEGELQLRYDRLKVRRARIQQKVHSGTSYSSNSSICSEGSTCNLSYNPEHPRQAERGREGHRNPALAPHPQPHLPGAQGPCINHAFHYTEQAKTVVHTAPPEFNNDLRVIVTPPQPYPSKATPRGGGRERSCPRSPKMSVSASTSNISVLLQAQQEEISKASCGSQPSLLEEVLESDLTKTPAVPFIVPPIQMRCDQSGGMYKMGDHDIQLKVPQGVIKKRATVDIQVGVCLHGPFAFPPNTQLVSPVIWLHVNSDVKLAKPVEVTVPHCLQVRTTEGASTTKMQFLRASCKPRATARGQTHKYQFSELDSKGVSTWEESSGTLATKQSSFLCIAAISTPATVSQTSYCLIMALPRPINSPTWKIQCCITYFLKTCIQAVERQFADQHEVLPLQKFHFAGSSTDAALSMEFERSIGGTGWLLALESSPTISPSDVNFMDPTHLMESLNLYPPRFTIRVHGEEAKCTTIARLAFKGCRETINMETVLPLRRQGCQVLSSPQTSTHCASCNCHEATATSSKGERDFLALNYGHGKLANGQHHHSTPNPSCETALVPPTDKELERVANEIVRRLGSGWLKLHTYLNVKEYQQDGDLPLKESATHIQLLDMLKKWRSTSQECTKTQLAACLKNTDGQLQEVANWLVHGQLLEQE